MPSDTKLENLLHWTRIIMKNNLIDENITLQFEETNQKDIIFIYHLLSCYQNLFNSSFQNIEESLDGIIQNEFIFITEDVIETNIKPVEWINSFELDGIVKLKQNKNIGSFIFEHLPNSTWIESLYCQDINQLFLQWLQNNPIRKSHPWKQRILYISKIIPFIFKSNNDLQILKNWIEQTENLSLALIVAIGASFTELIQKLKQCCLLKSKLNQNVLFDLPPLTVKTFNQAENTSIYRYMAYFQLKTHSRVFFIQ